LSEKGTNRDAEKRGRTESAQRPFEVFQGGMGPDRLDISRLRIITETGISEDEKGSPGTKVKGGKRGRGKSAIAGIRGEEDDKNSQGI